MNEAHTLLSDGEQVHDNGTQNLRGCRNSEFDQYGDMPAFEKLPYGGEWQRQYVKTFFLSEDGTDTKVLLWRDHRSKQKLRA